MIEQIRWAWCQMIRQHRNNIARFRLEGEYGVGYRECLDCGFTWDDL